MLACCKTTLYAQAFQVLTDYDKRYVYNEELQEALTAGDDDYTGQQMHVCQHLSSCMFVWVFCHL